MSGSGLQRPYQAALRFSLLVLLYVLFGRLGLLLAVPPGYATAIFPPAGLAVGAAFVFGASALPAIFLGSLALNLWVGPGTGAPIAGVVVGALIIAAGSAGQAAIGGRVLRRAIGYPAPLDNARDLTKFLLLAPAVCLVSATFSLSGLFLAGAVARADLATSWMAWWIGDTLGVLIVVPLLLVAAGEPRALWRKRVRHVAVPMVLFFALFVAIFVRVSAWEEQQSLLVFHLEAQHLADTTRASLDELGTILDELKVSFEVRRAPVTVEDFSGMASVVSAQFPVVQAVEWAPRVGGGNRVAFEQDERKFYASFAIRTRDRNGNMGAAPPTGEYYPVAFVSPLRDNANAVGFDLASNPVRRAALVDAIATGHVAASGPVRLVQEKENDTGILLVDSVPVGATGPGVALIVLRMGAFMRARLGARAPGIDARLIDDASGKPLFDSMNDPSRTLSIRQFQFGGRHYSIMMAPTPLYLSQHRGWQSWILLVAGVFGTGLIGALLMLGTGQTWRFESMLDQRTRDLRVANDRLLAEMGEREHAQAALHQSQRMKAIGQLTGGIAHDFNNLLMVVTGSIERLRLVVSGDKPARYLDMISAAAQRGEGLTRQLLSFAQLRPLKPQVTDVGALARSACDMIRQSLRGDIEVRLAVPQTACPVSIDPGEFDLALLNVAVNAQDSMPNGGVLTISVEPVVLRESVDGVSGPCFSVRIADTGAGIPADVLPRIFEPFFTTKTPGKGTGLGLSQVYGFSRQSGGTVTVASEIGHGTEITILLPACPEAPPEMKSGTDAPAGEALRPSEILVVEDDADVAAILVSQLEGLGHRVRRVGEGRTALAVLAGNSNVEIVVSDILMPGGVSGIDVARHIRSHYPHIGVLLVTGYSGGVVDPAHEGFALLRKPFDTPSLARALLDATRRSADGRSNGI